MNELTRAIAEATEGKDRAGTAKWPECCRDTYSLAIEEIAAALAPLIEARVREARAEALTEAAGSLYASALNAECATGASQRTWFMREMVGVLTNRAREVRRG